MTGLYIHVPFCVSRCRYCDFYREVSTERGAPGQFVQNLELELGRLPEGFSPDTVFLGGGTPTALSASELAELLDSIQRHINLSNVVEFSSEANPGTLTSEKLEVMKAGGINRVSLGVQSFNDKALRLLGRSHSAEQAVAGYEMVRVAGFNNINIDLIQSIPGMTPVEVLADAERLVELDPEHISFYNLIFEPETPLAQDLAEGRVIPSGDDEEADNYFAVKAFLESAGYGHYEISNFSKDGRRCRHNELYWQGAEYFGCGPSAHSHWRGKRFGNVANLSTWADRILQGVRPFGEVEELSVEEKAHETLVMGLRMVDGIDLVAFEAITGYRAEALCGEGIDSMIEEGLLQCLGNRLALTHDALFVCNAVFSELI